MIYNIISFFRTSRVRKKNFCSCSNQRRVLSTEAERIQNNSQFKNIAKTDENMLTCIDTMLSLSSIVYVQVCPAPKIVSKQQVDVALRVVVLLFLLCFILAIISPSLTLETSEVSTILVFTTTKTQPRPQVFSVNGAVTYRGLHF